MPKRHRPNVLSDAPDSADQVFGLLEAVDTYITELLVPAKDDLQAIFLRLTGRKLGSLEANQAAARRLQQLLDRLGMRVKCPRCGEPARLRCVAPRRMPQGCFQLEHYTEGRLTRHGAYAALPKLDLVTAPNIDRRRKTDSGQGLAADVD